MLQKLDTTWHGMPGREPGGFMERWKEQMQSENLLEGYRTEEVHRIHGWGAAFDGDGYGLHAENAGLHQGL